MSINTQANNPGTVQDDDLLMQNSASTNFDYRQPNNSARSLPTPRPHDIGQSTVSFHSAPEASSPTQDEQVISQPQKSGSGVVKGDGRINITISSAGVLGIEGRENHASAASLSSLRSLLEQSQAHLQKQRGQTGLRPTRKPVPVRYEAGQFFGVLPPEAEGIPKLNILMQVIGSRGDIQPFISLALVLAKHPYNHRVRLATHLCFKSFIEEVAKEHSLDNVATSRGSIEFYPLAGDPAALMSFMVRHPGLLPSMDALSGGDIRERRKGVWDILVSTWESCHQTYYPGHKPFVADVIIANPPGFGHIHCAEKLGIPLHIMFTMPWTPTYAFPHPLANLPKDLKSKLKGGLDEATVNYLTYSLIDILAWGGIGDLVNRFRTDILRLDSWNNIYAPALVNRLAEKGLVKHCYCWSPALIPKPDDWGSDNTISISGWWFLDLKSGYVPSAALTEFLSTRSEKPFIYIGFGSIVAPNPEHLTAVVLEAISLAGVRALVSKGWGTISPPENFQNPDVFFLENTPHDYLFPRVSLAVHHGGAGTTAAAIKAGIPQVIIPFFGDQQFWGDMVERKRAGGVCHNSLLTAEILRTLIQQCLTEEVRDNSRRLANIVNNENGAEVAAQSFIESIAPTIKTCEIEEKLPTNTQPENPGLAVFSVMVPVPGGGEASEHNMREIHISARTAAILDAAGLIDLTNEKSVRLARRIEYGPHIRDLSETDPVTGGAGALLGTLVGIGLAGGVDFDRQRVFGGRSTKDIDSQARSPESANKTKKGWDLETFNDIMSARKPISNIIDASIRAPVDLSLSVSRGFHNLPSLFKDDTVRPLPTVHTEITGVKSGITVASKQLATGLYDGISGLVTQPIKGTKEGGVGGFFKGVGKGISGVVLRPAAGIWGVPGYMGTGVIKQIEKIAGLNPWEKQLRTMRIAEGRELEKDIQNYEREGIVNTWKATFGDSPVTDRKGKGKAIARTSSAGSGEQFKETVRQKFEGMSPLWQEFMKSQPCLSPDKRTSPSSKGSPVKSPNELYPPGQELGIVTASSASRDSNNVPQNVPTNETSEYEGQTSFERAISGSHGQQSIQSQHVTPQGMSRDYGDISRVDSPNQPHSQPQLVFSNNTTIDDAEFYVPADGFNSYQPSVLSPTNSAFAPTPSPLFHRSSSSLTTTSDVKSTVPDLEPPSYDRSTPTLSASSPTTVDAKIAAGAFSQPPQTPPSQVPVPSMFSLPAQAQSVTNSHHLSPPASTYTTTDGGWTPTGSTANSVSGQQFTPTASTVDLTEMHSELVDDDDEALKWAIEQSLKEHTQSQQASSSWNALPASLHHHHQHYQQQPFYAGHTNDTYMYEDGNNFNVPYSPPPPRPPRPDIYLRDEAVNRVSSPSPPPPPPPRPSVLYQEPPSINRSASNISSYHNLQAPYVSEQRSLSTGDLNSYAGTHHRANVNDNNDDADDDENDEELLAAIEASKETARLEEERQRKRDDDELIDYMKRVGLARG